MELNSDKQLNAEKVPTQVSKKNRIVSISVVWTVVLLLLAIDIFFHNGIFGLIICPLGLAFFPIGSLDFLPEKLQSTMPGYPFGELLAFFGVGNLFGTYVGCVFQ